MTEGPSDLSPAPGDRQRGTEPQDVDAPLSTAATFLVLRIADGTQAAAAAASAVGSTGDLVKDVRVRTADNLFSCNVGISHGAWGRLTDRPAPAELRPFAEVRGERHTAVATPGDLLFHIRASSRDVIVEFEKLLLAALGDSVVVEDDVAGFRYFDGRDLLEFVDGTANPDGLDLAAATLVGDEDAAYAGGSYVVVQKYLHDLDAWKRAGTAAQESIIGRTKFDNAELPDAGPREQKSHKTLCTISDEDGEHDILRDNMPFANPGRAEYGTYFIGYSRHLWVTEQMIRRMFVGDPPGKHDRVLDFSTAVTGVTFFVPPRAFLADLGG